MKNITIANIKEEMLEYTATTGDILNVAGWDFIQILDEDDEVESVEYKHVWLECKLESCRACRIKNICKDRIA